MTTHHKTGIPAGCSEKPHMAFREAAEEYLLECKLRNLTKESLRRYKSALQRLQARLEELDLQWADLTAYDLPHRIVPDMLATGLSLRSINCDLCIIKEFFKFLVREGWEQTNIAADVKPFKIEPSLTHTFSDEHIKRLFK